ncbi:MAG: hypothetical protein NXY57DRAFT_1025229 [Lentinula lateritia]|nr:MAG: hypothetical protein NXY57DRAFT_1025229 [Lentinula lateritia]
MFFLRYALFIAGCILDIPHIHALAHPRPPDKPDWAFSDRSALSPPFPSVDKTVFDSPLAEPKPTVSVSVKLGWAKVARVFNYNSNKDHEGNEVEKGEMVLITLVRQCERPRAVDVLRYTKQLVDVGRASNEAAAMIIRGRIGWPMEVELKKRNAQDREEEVWEAVCDKVVYFATEYQVLYVYVNCLLPTRFCFVYPPVFLHRGLDLLYHVLVHISVDPTEKPEITLLGWHQHYFIRKGTPEDKIVSQ